MGIFHENIRFFAYKGLSPEIGLGPQAINYSVQALPHPTGQVCDATSVSLSQSKQIQSD